MTKELVKKIIDGGFTLLDYLIIKDVETERFDFVTDEFFALQVIEMKGNDMLSENNRLTIKSKAFIQGIADNTNSHIDFYVDLHDKLQRKIHELTGTRQVRIQGKYSFLPNAVDIKYKLQKVIKKYNIEDLKKVEKVLLRYVVRSHQANFEKVMLIDYYIMKDNVSKFITDYENYSEKDERSGDIQKGTDGTFLI